MIDPALAERMAALIRSITNPDVSGYNNYAEARAIAALLPKPVDPNLIEARLVAGKVTAEDYSDGALDYTFTIQAALTGIKAGRAASSGGSHD